MGGSQGELFATQEGEVTLTNGYLCSQSCHSNGSINGQLEVGGEDDVVDDQRGDVCFNPIYNLYAISVGVLACGLLWDGNWGVGHRSWVVSEWQKA